MTKIIVTQGENATGTGKGFFAHYDTDEGRVQIWSHLPHLEPTDEITFQALVDAVARCYSGALQSARDEAEHILSEFAETLDSEGLEPFEYEFPWQKPEVSNLAPLDADGRLTIRHITAGRDGRGVETTLCGLTIPKDAEPSRSNDECTTCIERDG